LLPTRPASGQVATGFPPYGSFGGGPFDTVNNANLNVHFGIPIFSRAGRGIPFSYILSYDSSVWSPVNSAGGAVWTPVGQTSTMTTNWGWRGVTEAQAGYISYQIVNHNCIVNGYLRGVYSFYIGWTYHDVAGTPHNFLITTNTGDSYCGINPVTSGTATATDGSGYTMKVTNYTASVVYSRSGETIHVPINSTSGSGSVTDSNGNQISASVSSNTTTFTDTLGTTALTIVAPGAGSSTTYTYPGPNGNGVYTVKYTSYTVQTNFGCSGVTEYGATQQYLVSEIDLPDQASNPNDKYTFTYETTRGYSSSVTGRLASITLPTGGTISYNYYFAGGGITCADGSADVLARTTIDGPTTYYHSENGSAWTTSVLDYQNDQTVYNFQGIYETEQQVNQGTSTLLKTVSTCYNGNTSSCNTTAVTLPITQVTATTTLGSLQSKTNANYNSYGLPTEVDLYAFGSGGAGGLVRKTLTTYNTSLNGIYIYDRPSNIQVEDSGGTTRAQSAYSYDGYGNLTQETRYTGGTPSTISRSFTPGSYGVLTSATDFNGNPTNYSSFTCNGAFPQTITSGGLTTQQTWSCNGGVITLVTDPNSQPTSYSYDTTHNFWRLAATSFPDGGSTSTIYTNPTELDRYTAVTSSLTRHDLLDLDGLGRVETSSLVNDPDGQTYVSTSYDFLGRLSTVSNPYRGSSSGGDTYAYDALNRVTQVTHADSSYSQISYGGTASQNCSASTYGYGFPILSADESGNKRQTFTDALGRVIEADEPTSSSNVPSVYTCYIYDVLGNLKEVDQGSETRKYAYDMLSRPTSATTPEAQNNTRYFYYTTSSSTLCSGNPSVACQRTDERGITANYSYDALDRLTGMTYSNGDPSVSYSYDQTSYNGLTIANGKGRRTGMSDASGQTGWSYDAMGRVAAEERTIGSVTATLGYSHNLDGSLASVTYPSGRTVTYTVSAVGRPLTAVDNGHSITYVGSANATYAPQGALATASYGANIAFSATYNNRLLLSGIEGYNTSTSTTFFERQPAYNYNGTVSSVTNVLNSSRTQSFTYDYLNRIISAQSTAISGTYCWGQSIPTNGTGYDRYGNLLIINSTQCSAPTLSLSVNYYNQITNSGYSYDASGNMTADGLHSYTWNGEGLLKSAGTTNYTYDGDGKRVEKSSGTYYWFSPSGSPLAETNTSGSTLNEYIYFSAGRTARRDSSGNVYYYFQDQIGTSRLIANSSGTVCYDADYTPFGYEMAYATTCTQNYKFTGMERDTETGNDHGLFRNYEQNLGRWMSPDRSSGSVTNPQSLNRYTYVLNNPTTLTDSTGLRPTGPTYMPVYTCDNSAGNDISSGCAGGGDAGNAIFGNDIFDAIMGAAGYSVYNTPFGLGFGFDPSSAALSPFQYQFTGTLYGTSYANNPQTFNTWDQYADWASSIAALPQNQPGYLDAVNAQLAYVIGLLEQMGVDENDPRMAAFEAANSDLLSLNVQGGNVDFNNVGANGQLIFNFGCDNDRCDNGLDFSHDQGNTFHADTADPYNDVVSAFEHFGVDIIGGNFVWNVIPRH
jgi:RHS repeat-associated protein